MRRVAGVFPLKLRPWRNASPWRNAPPWRNASWRKVHVSTWAAALVLAGLCVLASLYIADRAALYLDLADRSPPPKPHTAPRVANIPPAPSQSVNRAKKAARETGKNGKIDARMAPGSFAPGHFAPGNLATPEAWKPIEPGSGDPSRLGATRRAPQDEEGVAGETGRASWYALPGPTASGEAMDATALTAAHPTFPLGTKVRVENLDNGRAVVVRINDRGPFAKDRIIDLSKAAAAELGMIEDGVAQVSVTPVEDVVATNIKASSEAPPLRR